MAVHPCVGPWPLFSFVILFTAIRTPRTGNQPIAHAGTQTQNKRTQTFMLQVGFKPTIPVFEWRKKFYGRRPRGHFDRQPVISLERRGSAYMYIMYVCRCTVRVINTDRFWLEETPRTDDIFFIQILYQDGDIVTTGQFAVRNTWNALSLV
jgi:hypothetical protein